ncbi:MAG: phage tail protein [Phycisphaeraceae bacterium]|nr:phage tail protein [Phycisphaeraceae bacterium]
MSEPFIAEIRIFAGNFAPRNWAFCNGSLLPIAQNTALFSLVGTTYGGDGRTTFGLPNLEGRVPMHAGNGPGLTSRRLGEVGGVTTVTLNASQMASHTHQLRGSDEDNDSTLPQGHAHGLQSIVYRPASNLQPMAAGSLPPVGGGGAHTNLQPHLAINFVIAVVGLYPSRSARAAETYTTVTGGDSADPPDPVPQTSTRWKEIRDKVRRRRREWRRRRR